MLPSIANEIDNQIGVYHALINRIDELEHIISQSHIQMEGGPSVSETNMTSQEPKLLQEYSRLRAHMRARMEEIAIFYDDNMDDERIHFFEKLRLKIKKALHNRPGKAGASQEQ